MLHDLKHKGTELMGFSTVKGTFTGCHIILIVLKDGAQEYPHGLGPGSHISDPDLLCWQWRWKLPPGLQGLAKQPESQESDEGSTDCAPLPSKQ